jgi:hypothetical protein
MYDVPHEDISLLGTRAMLCKHNKRLALEYVYIEDYVLNPVCEVKWVQQIILLGHKGSCNVTPWQAVEGHRAEIKPNELRVMFSRGGSGKICQSLESLLTGNRRSSLILSVSDEDYVYIKEHWDEMDRIQRFWWMHDHGFYRRFIEQ